MLESRNQRDTMQPVSVTIMSTRGILSDGQHLHDHWICRPQKPILVLGVGDLLGLMPGRVTYVFDQTGLCVLSFNSALNANKHVDQAIAAIKSLAA